MTTATDFRPVLWRHARLVRDPVRGRDVLLYPEGALFLNATGVEILALCDGAHSVGDVSTVLGAKYSADVSADVSAFIDRLRATALLRDVSDGTAAHRVTVSPSLAGTTPATQRARTPTTLLAELTHRCPLHCPYCSNPLDLARANQELSTDDWLRVIRDARALGVLQMGFSGGEPLMRRDLEVLVAEARSLGLYTTLVTSGLGLTKSRAESLRDAGIDHVQLSLQDATAERAERIAGAHSFEAKQRAARIIREMEVAFTVNVVLHRANLDHLGEILAQAAAWHPDRVELANTQYYGWALTNRDALLPTREQLDAAELVVDAAIAEYGSGMQILYVLPDYFERYPKPCMGGWGNVYIVVAPDGRVMPCHAAPHIDGMEFTNARSASLANIWDESPAFTAFRGNAWMADPCASCDRQGMDFGGCRCQAAALLGDARLADPICERSPHRDVIDRALASARTDGFTYRPNPPRSSS